MSEPKLEPVVASELDAQGITSQGESLPVALVDEELLVEDVSIDGMCGVY